MITLVVLCFVSRAASGAVPRGLSLSFALLMQQALKSLLGLVTPAIDFDREPCLCFRVGWAEKRERRMAAAVAAAQERGLPKIDFTGVGQADTGSPSWEAVREQVMQALGSYGCFEAVYDRVTPQLRGSILEMAAEELFPLPLEAKIKNTSDKPFGGYLGQISGFDYESLAITDAPLPHGAPRFCGLLWPDGNPDFCEKAYTFSKKLGELEEMVRRMVLESLGVTEYHEEQSASIWYLLRFSKYGAVGDGEQEEEGERKKAGYMAHRDVNTLGIVCQLNGVDGLEVDSGDGQWIPAKPSSPTSYFVIAGDTFRAWSNGRVTAPLHRVNVGGEDTRYSVILFSVPKDEAVIQAPAELVDERRPTLFRPFAFGEFLRFCATEEGMKAECKLSAYCGRAAAAEAAEA
ncbi:unnamed protein product [Musa acuminata subsp. malaccensis]|uniref:2-oxoglutarate-dependent dioxygenase DAO n=1 Tax=Musa acuminata subsp. malaccensis TaxID=214687 RepID=A0A804ITM5_MUSAM|nr:PREDICTED: probable 2-oxoglutarate-dependent dioxygenase AOP1 [Musa acuminata subsp. malaccensis]CAG1843320.1 unnamed protein product [Musa acuminata subsp. malaccensis]